ncbi:hypothetical protein BT96DRAFT_963912 [Gymnopus androsaceus JB14]|uniref:Myosin-binding domain-containing protein n=1 Tax=Gymnopus androsaceus JB14 TaxID=1447944 RepID=A0A6A4I4N1_9AGAR|nr:hypothetical protein BT96DRAFT_963912 [Gymnopus androsaceus JB14]
MAQPVFDDHPLEQYLREAGEAPDLMPGGVAEFNTPQSEDEDSFYEDGTNPETCSNFLRDIAQVVRSMVLTQSSSAFVERFKYSVISSSLLSSSLVQPNNLRPPRLPGHHSRNSSLDTPETSHQPIHSLPSDSSHYIFFLALALVTVLFGAGYYFTSALILGISASLLYIWNPESSKYDMTPYLDTLNDLIAAGTVWDSVVQEAMTNLEKDDQTTSITPLSPSSLRVALHSTLLTTQSQCDDVRQLLSALTSHSELSQISEMYAPPSPMSSKSFLPLSPTRPFSYPESSYTRTTHHICALPHRRTSEQPGIGSYASLANAGSPSMQFTKRREKRRSDLSALLHVFWRRPKQEAKLETLALGESFGSAALRLRRTRTIGGLNVLRVSSSVPNSPPMTNLPVRSPRSAQSQFATLPSASRFTAIQAPRHPLSFSSLSIALQNALASKRYACSHLLALRFAEEGDDEGYWEDVKSVMMLLTSTLVDASARLTEALEDADDQKLKDSTPSPSAAQAELRMADVMMFGETRRSSLLRGRGRARHESFAPMPSHLNRFATHVEAISSALDDAREHLVECVAALKEPSTEEPSSDEGSTNVEHPALQAYERLRRELGLALRECERGRERLLDAISTPRQHSESEDESSSEDHAPDLPALAHDASDDSDEKHEPPEYEIAVDIVSALDDVTSHLLLTSTSTHLPPPGVEQVYEGDSGTAPTFNRERSKLSREERIQLARKAKEEGQLSRETWGPGGEVVQELKDVIWKPSIRI